MTTTIKWRSINNKTRRETERMRQISMLQVARKLNFCNLQLDCKWLSIEREKRSLSISLVVSLFVFRLALVANNFTIKPSIGLSAIQLTCKWLMSTLSSFLFLLLDGISAKKVTTTTTTSTTTTTTTTWTFNDSTNSRKITACLQWYFYHHYCNYYY